MPEQTSDWQIQQVTPPSWFVATVQQASEHGGPYAAQLLWQRGIRDPKQLAGYLNPDQYQPTGPDAFGQETQWAVERLLQARDRQERVTIWGDFDADGITATAVLWEGLGQFFQQQQTLFYLIPNRLTESHGLNRSGITALAAQNCRLIVTCDTGCSNAAEIAYAQSLGIDVIITDHHTLPAIRPPVTAMLNPRNLAADHPLAHLSGVAVAYKLVEALYLALPDVPQKPLEQLLDLVAIGLIADLVLLTGDSRYLAQRGIQQLQQQLTERSRPGVARLLELCKRSGDRPTDIAFGIGPRINAVSRIQGDASFCVELLTSHDPQRCQELAEATELANGRRKALQREVSDQVKARLEKLDLSTHSVIVLMDTQWPVGILGLVAGQIAQAYNRPTILLRADALDLVAASNAPHAEILARGSARSVNQLDLYQLMADQAHLLHQFGGHPFAAGLSLPIANVPLFTQAINQKLRQQSRSVVSTRSVISADLTVTVAALGQDLFRELKLLEPCGMGNPVPKLLIRNCWFENVWHQNLQDNRGNKLRYIKTSFEICDDSAPQGCPGIWWEHYKEEIPQGRCDAIVELDFNTASKKKTVSPYQVRLLDVRPSNAAFRQTAAQVNWVLDWRQSQPQPEPDAVLVMQHCPADWGDLRSWFRQALQRQQPLAIAYSAPQATPPEQIWTQLVGLAKYLCRTETPVTLTQLQNRLQISAATLQLGLQALTTYGFDLKQQDQTLHFNIQALRAPATATNDMPEALQQFLTFVAEEQFRHQYFAQVDFEVIQAVAQETAQEQRSTTPS